MVVDPLHVGAWNFIDKCVHDDVYCELKCVCVLYTHNDFHKKCGLTYVDPKKHWSPRKPPPWQSQMNAKSQIWNTKQHIHWTPRFDKAVVCLDNGELKKQLDTMLNHIPTDPAGKKGDMNCQLHRWAHREITAQNVVPPGGWQHVILCKDYGLNICLCCWEIFHSQPNLNKIISDALSFTWMIIEKQFNSNLPPFFYYM